MNYIDWLWNVELASPSQDKSHLIVTSFLYVVGFYLLMFYWGGKNQETQPYWSFFTFLCICLLLLTSQILQIVASLLSVVYADFQLESVEEIKSGKLTPSWWGPELCHYFWMFFINCTSNKSAFKWRIQSIHIMLIFFISFHFIFYTICGLWYFSVV